MARIGKSGYIEVPSRAAKASRGSEPSVAGLSHHRWLIDIEAQSVPFLMKFHCIHRWKCSLPATYLRSLSEEDKVRWLFWNDTFDFSETVIHGAEEQAAELERFVRSVRPYSTLALAGERAVEKTIHFANRVAGYARRHLPARKPSFG